VGRVLKVVEPVHTSRLGWISAYGDHGITEAVQLAPIRSRSVRPSMYRRQASSGWGHGSRGLSRLATSSAVTFELPQIQDALVGDKPMDTGRGRKYGQAPRDIVGARMAIVLQSRPHR
jgi:hypothetical protein